MSRLRLLLLSVLAAFAVAGVASASASAVEFQVCANAGAGHKYATELECELETPGVGEWGWVGIAPAATVAGEGISGPSTLSVKIGGVTLTIQCKKDKFTGKLESAGKSSKAVIKYEECAITGAWGTKCEVETTLTTGELKDALSVVGGRIVDTFEPEPPETHFIELVVKKRTGQTCSLESTYPVTGKQECGVDKNNAEAESGKQTHELICKKAGSKLELGGKNAEYEGTASVFLATRHYWRMK